VQASNFNALSGNIYPVNTTSGAITSTLPSSPSAGNQISFIDYAGTFSVNNLTINPNGSKIRGTTNNRLVISNDNALTLIYLDSTTGWAVVNASTQTPFAPTVEALVVAGGGGGGGGNHPGAGGGGGGVLYGTQVTIISGTSYTVTVGAGGAGGQGLDPPNGTGGTGSNSVFATLTANGGGGGGAFYGSNTGLAGGSGGGGVGRGTFAGGASNQTAPAGVISYGNIGGSSFSPGDPYRGGGGGGAGAAGANATSTNGGNGGAGIALSITGTSITYAGGGGGGSYNGGTEGTGGAGGGGTATTTPGTAGSTNTGGGGGTFANDAPGGGAIGGAGGSGIVIIAYPNTMANLTSIGAGLTYSFSSSRSGYRVYTFTQGTGTITW
jgi:hypothetical protein